MKPDGQTQLLPPQVARLLGWSVVFTLLVIVCFTFPLMPSYELDPSWRMALGYFFEEGMQFGSDVVFTYGPLGFIMGKTFSGLQFWSLIAGQLTLAVISAVVILRQGLRIKKGTTQLVFFLSIILFGITYEDALHMLVIGILGFELLRLKDSPRYPYIVLIGAVLALYSQIKFTDLLLASYIILLVTAYGLWGKKWRAVAFLCGSYLIAYLGIWIGSGQNVLNLPAYLRGSWEISQGYQWAMGSPSPEIPLLMGLTVLGILIVYAIAHVLLHSNKPRAVANTLLLGAFIYLNWKHGFVRADGHMIGFFYCALLPLTTYPYLLDDSLRFEKIHRWIFIVAIAFSLIGLENSLWGVVRQSLAIVQRKAWDNIESVVHWENTRQVYRDQLSIARKSVNLHQTKELIGEATLDVLGFEQSAALLNRFNYKPRPVIQSYSTFMPYLAKLNGDFFASDKAPEYVLMKIQSIDGRLPMMDDPHVMALLAYRYEYIRIEKNFYLWKRNDDPFDSEIFKPKFIRSQSEPINTELNIKDLTSQPLWLVADLKPSLLGKVRSFLYKPPQVMLSIKDVAGNSRDYLMPLPQGRTGFIVSPIIEDIIDYMHFSNNDSLKQVLSIEVRIPPEHEKYFESSVELEFSSLPPAHSGKNFFSNINKRLFHMFKNYPISYYSETDFSVATVDGRDIAIMHAPSQMIFDLPSGAKLIRGIYGMMPGTYLDGGSTNGAGYIIYWSNGTTRVELFRKFLNPVNVEIDRGLHSFECDLTNLNGGRLYLEVESGPYNDKGWDWTGWSDIDIH